VPLIHEKDQNKLNSFQVDIYLILMEFRNSSGTEDPKDPLYWKASEIDNWFEKGEWLEGLTVAPDASINRKALAVSYFRDPDKWRKSFDFIRKSIQGDIEFRKYDIDGDKVYAIISGYPSRNEEDCRYEAHRKYIDIQYVLKGSELIGHADIKGRKEILSPYDPVNDIEFMTVDEGKNLKASQNSFFIFFPEDVHRPGIQDGKNSIVEKIVVKLIADRYNETL
jgi:YhcH/YjgK/YiaL family protein